MQYCGRVACCGAVEGAGRPSNQPLGLGKRPGSWAVPGLGLFEACVSCGEVPCDPCCGTQLTSAPGPTGRAALGPVFFSAPG